MKVAVVPPPGTVTLAGTVAAPVLLLDSDTTAPPLGAGPLSVTVPLDELPPVTLDGLRLSEESVGASGTNVAVTVFAAFIVIVHVVPEDVSHPPQLPNVDPLAALAVRVTTVPLS